MTTRDDALQLAYELGQQGDCTAEGIEEQVQDLFPVTADEVEAAWLAGMRSRYTGYAPGLAA